MWKMDARGSWGPDTVSNEKIYVSAYQVQKNTEPLFAQLSQIINYFWSELEPNVMVRSQVFGAFSVCSWSIIKSLCSLCQFPTSLKMSFENAITIFLLEWTPSVVQLKSNKSWIVMGNLW